MKESNTWKSFRAFYTISLDFKDDIAAHEEESLKDADSWEVKSEMNPIKDVIYLSEHSTSRQLTRVLALRAPESGVVEVFNIDDLTFETVDTSGIHHFPNSMGNLNTSMTVVKLFNIEFSKEICKDSVVALNRITELMHHKLLYAVIRQFNGNIPLVDIYEDNTTNLVYQRLLDEGLFKRSNEVLIIEPSIIPSEIKKYDIIDQHEQEFVGIFKTFKNNSTHPMIFPLIDKHVENMRNLDKALNKLVLHYLPKVTAPFLNKTCIVYSSISMKHCRAKILSEKFSNFHVKVFYIDKGTTETVALKFIRQIPPALMFYDAKLLEVSLHNFQFKKECEEKIKTDLIHIMKDHIMTVLIRAFDDDGIAIVDLCKIGSGGPVLMYQEIFDKLTPVPMMSSIKSSKECSIKSSKESPKESSKESSKEYSIKSSDSKTILQLHDDEFLCTFGYFVGPYNVAIFPIIDNVHLVTEEIKTNYTGLKNNGPLKAVSNPDYDTIYYACIPGDSSCYLSRIVHFYGDTKRVEIQLLEYDKYMFVQLKDLYLVPDMELGPIEVTLNFRFDAKFDELIVMELNKVLKYKSIKVVIRECKPNSLMVVDMYEVGSKQLIYQDLLDMIYEMKVKSLQQITPKGVNLDDNSVGQNLNPNDVDLMTFDDVAVNQSFKKQQIKRIFFNDVDVILKSLGVGVFTCILFEFTTLNDFKVLPLIEPIVDEIEPLEVQVQKFHKQKLSILLYKVRINENLDLEEFEDKFFMFMGDQSFTAVVRGCDNNGIPLVDLYGSNPFILAYQDFINDGSMVVDDEETE
ncbi:unnamed protein product [Diamesa serratosioi]